MDRTHDRARYVLLIRVPRAVEVRIEDIFLHLQGTTKPLMGYHVTVLGPFQLPAGSDPLGLVGIEEVCRRQPPIEIELAGLGGFISHDDNAIFVHVVDSEEGLRLHAELLASLAEQIEFPDERARLWNVRDYRPHVTLGLGLSDKQFESLLRAASDRHCHARFVAHEVLLMVQAPNEPWRTIATYPLGPAAAPSADRDQH
ncbi:MAG: 2'-5' RNA ligase family protein [Chloroflexota bacterium]